MSIGNIKDSKNAIDDIRALNKITLKYLKFAFDDIDYQMIADDLLRLSDAKFTIVSIFNKDKQTMSIKAISSKIEFLYKASKIIGFNPVQKEWKVDSDVIPDLKIGTLYKLSGLCELSFRQIPKKIAYLLEKTFKFGDTFSIGITDGEEIIGTLSMVMSKEKSIKSARIIELFANQLGIVLFGKKAQKELLKREGKLKYYNEFKDIITNLSTRFINITAGEIDTSIDEALSTIGKFADVDRSYVFLLSKNKAYGSNTNEWCSDGIEPQKNNLQNIPAESVPWWTHKLKKFEHIYIPDVKKMPPEAKAEKEILEAQPVKSLIVVPITYKKKLTGFLGFDSVKNKKTWTEESISLLKIVGEIFASAISRKEVEYELRKSEEKFKYLSFHDKLTGLYSRTFFEVELKRLDAKRQLPISLIVGDINGLKLVNDAFSHKDGDRLLKKAAKTLKKACRTEDIIARIGGDEFSIVLPRTRIEEALNIAKRIKNCCTKETSTPIQLSIAMGVATKNRPSQKIQSIFKKAEDRMYSNKLIESKSISSSIILSLQKSLEERTYETEEHTDRLKKNALNLGKFLGLRDDKLDELKLLAAHHDIGKIAISDIILDKPDSLTSKEWKIMKKHCEIGYRIASASSGLAIIADAILSHHEWWNGRGYPQGLKGEKIPITSRIISVVDAYDTMTHKRHYKKTLSKKKAIYELKKFSGSQFDPKIVKSFIKMIST